VKDRIYDCMVDILENMNGNNIPLKHVHFKFDCDENTSTELHKSLLTLDKCMLDDQSKFNQTDYIDLLEKSIVEDDAETVLHILQADPSLTFNCSHNGNLTVLHLASKYGASDVAKIMLYGLELNHGLKNIPVDQRSNDHDKTTALFWAIRFGHGNIVSELIDAGADVNLLNVYGDSALRVAVNYCQFSTLEKLISNSNDDYSNFTCVSVLGFLIQRHIYSKYFMQMFSALLGIINDIHIEHNDGKHILHYLIERQNSLEAITLLLNFGLNIRHFVFRDYWPLEFCVKYGRLDVLHLLSHNVYDQDTLAYALLTAVSEAEIKFIKILTEAGADVNYKFSKVHRATRKPLKKRNHTQSILRRALMGSIINFDVLQYLIQQGADPSYDCPPGFFVRRQPLFKKSDASFFIKQSEYHISMQKLMSFVLACRPALVDAKCQESGNSGLWVAAVNNYLCYCILFLQWGANLHTKNSSGITLLQFLLKSWPKYLTDFKRNLLIRIVLTILHAMTDVASEQWLYTFADTDELVNREHNDIPESIMNTIHAKISNPCMLKQLCRSVIMNHMDREPISIFGVVSLDSRLYSSIPNIGLPPMLQRYLCYEDMCIFQYEQQCFEHSNHTQIYTSITGKDCESCKNQCLCLLV